MKWLAYLCSILALCSVSALVSADTTVIELEVAYCDEDSVCDAQEDADSCPADCQSNEDTSETGRSPSGYRSRYSGNEFPAGLATSSMGSHENSLAPSRPEDELIEDSGGQQGAGFDPGNETVDPIDGVAPHQESGAAEGVATMRSRLAQIVDTTPIALRILVLILVYLGILKLFTLFLSR